MRFRVNFVTIFSELYSTYGLSKVNGKTFSLVNQINIGVFMKLRPLVKAIGLTLVVSQAAYASPNGKPFRALNALIEENTTAIDANGDLIEQNGDAILSLSSMLSALDGRVGTLETDVAGLTTRFGAVKLLVDDNTAEIVMANARITAVKVELTDLSLDVANNTQAIDDAEAEIAATNVRIVDLTADLAATNDNVAVNAAAIIDVEANIAAAELLLAQLQLDVVANAEEIAQTESDLNDLNASHDSLQAIVETNTTDIAQTEADIETAQGNLATLTTQYNDLVTLVQTNADTSDEAIATLRAEILTLIEANEDEIVINQAELVLLNDDLLQLAMDNTALANDLRAQMHAFSLLIDSNTTSIGALQTQIATLSASLSALNSSYNSLAALQIVLAGHVDDHHIELAQLTSDLNSLTVRVAMVEMGPGEAEFTFTDTPGDDVPPDALYQFLLANNNGLHTHIYVQASRLGVTAQYCMENAQWYIDNYIAFSQNRGNRVSGSWGKWASRNGSPWSSRTQAQRPNYYGPACIGAAYDWCAEWGLNGTTIAVLPARSQSFNQGTEVYANGHSRGNGAFTLRLGPSRASACGF